MPQFNGDLHLGPKSVAMTAGEAAHPRYSLLRSFKSIVTRLLVLFILILSAACVRTLVPYTDSKLLPTTVVRPGVGTFPYVTAMERLHIGGLAHVVNALVMLSIFSANNSYVYTSSRILFGMALEGCVPRLGSTSAEDHLLRNGFRVGRLRHDLVRLYSVPRRTFEPSGYISIQANTVIFQALKAQGTPRESLPHRSALQPFCGHSAFFESFLMTPGAKTDAYAVFLPGNWDALTFVFSYTLILLLPVIFVGRKLACRTQWRMLRDINLFTEERADIDAYESKLKGSGVKI
ncbi:amino acid permease-domain-containing protein [Mycena albidolilacea]|uniref:Amino acid permease-domain-containing protein n=1 Tax=Mycena albidolilacea TaxID=1033008 RepID=A0AAD7A8T7_9AGAR|nr:amino acid permease-domain-containing protein [Mycena albidolilacea]